MLSDEFSSSINPSSKRHLAGRQKPSFNVGTSDTSEAFGVVEAITFPKRRRDYTKWVNISHPRGFFESLSNWICRVQYIRSTTTGSSATKVARPPSTRPRSLVRGHQRTVICSRPVFLYLSLLGVFFCLRQFVLLVLHFSTKSHQSTSAAVALFVIAVLGLWMLVCS